MENRKEYMIRRIIRNLFEVSEVEPMETIRILEELTKTGKEAFAE